MLLEVATLDHLHSLLISLLFHLSQLPPQIVVVVPCIQSGITHQLIMNIRLEVFEVPLEPINLGDDPPPLPACFILGCLQEPCKLLLDPLVHLLLPLWGESLQTLLVQSLECPRQEYFQLSLLVRDIEVCRLI